MEDLTLENVAEAWNILSDEEKDRIELAIIAIKSTLEKHNQEAIFSGNEKLQATLGDILFAISSVTTKIDLTRNPGLKFAIE